MLEGLDAIDWTTLHGAYGPAGEVPELIRALADRDAETAAKARGRLEGWIIHQGTTYSASAPAVPFVAALLCDGATHHRGGLARMLGELAAFNNQRTKHVAAVRAAVEAEVDRLTPLLEEADAEVRDGVAFALSQCPKSKRRTLPRLRARFAVEPEPQLRARLLAAVQWLDRKTPLVAESLGADRHPAVRAAAALILARSDQPWNEPATLAVREAWDGGEPLSSCWWWGWRSSPLQELIAGLGDKGADGAAVLGMLLASSADPVREQAAAATVLLVRAERRAREPLVPMLTRALADGSAQVRRDAARALSEAGAAARPAADALAQEAVLAPAGLGALVRFDDPRWPALAAARLRTGADVERTLEALYEAHIPFDREVMDAITATDPQTWHRWGIYLLASWGADAAPAVPQLRDLLDTNLGAWALDALTAIGPAASEILPRLRAALDGPPVVKEYGNRRVPHVAERIAVLRIGGDPAPALDAARAALAVLRGRPTGGFYDLPHDGAVALLDALGEHGRELLPEVRGLVALRADLIGPARALWRWTADPEEVLPTVRTVLDLAGTQFRQRTPQYPGLPAIALAVELGDASLAPLLRPFLADPTSRTRVPAARGIWRLTGDVDGLVAPLLREVTGRPPGPRWREALDLLAEIGPPAAAARDELHAAAAHPRCPFVDEFDYRDDRWLGHRDDTYLAGVRAAIAALG
ncbi:hypothetical protein Val02_31290 [Virgisporangium aliadipatigenens]|uniref:HEAT repeat domain-containing protein n=1 Tax=Virgisporangium aliadipatigenens TaxID=741659 RepID=A0A8J4DQZ3_9ACTN|nr:hypothetical protein [Virgisporangium aliadipatigenens]GIJ46243.1 hypothetical protein Val02_31290 [Virgisporangium aliadipatigenens]